MDWRDRLRCSLKEEILVVDIDLLILARPAKQLSKDVSPCECGQTVSKEPGDKCLARLFPGGDSSDYSNKGLVLYVGEREFSFGEQELRWCRCIDPGVFTIVLVDGVCKGKYLAHVRYIHAGRRFSTFSAWSCGESSRKYSVDDRGTHRGTIITLKL